MRSVHFVHSFSKLSETFIYDYITSLKAQQVDVRVLTFSHLNQNERPFEPVEVVDLPWWNMRRIWNISRDRLLGKDTETSAWPVYQKKLKKIISEQSPDVLHAHFGTMGVLLEPVARELNIPLVVTFYGYDISELASKSNWKKAYRRLAETAYITVLSEEMKARAIDLGFSQEQTKVIHLGTKLNEVEYQLPSHPIRHFISVGRLSEKKGHLDTLQAFKEILRQSDENLKLSIIGEGEDREKLVSYIKYNDLEQNISLLGSIPHAEVIKYLHEADAFILNSKTASGGDKEGTPTVLVEAQAAGLPCISTVHSGIPEIIPPENHHLLAEEGNISQITANIRKLIEAPQDEIKEISRLGRKQVEEAFDVMGEAEKFKILYKQLSL